MNDIDDYWNKRVSHLEEEMGRLRKRVARLGEVIGAVQEAERLLDTGDDPDEEEALLGRYSDAIDQLLHYDLNHEKVGTADQWEPT